MSTTISGARRSSWQPMALRDRLARFDLIVGLIMLALAAAGYASAQDAAADAIRRHGRNIDSGVHAWLFAVGVALPYGVLLLAAAVSLRRWRRFGLAMHALAWGWPLLVLAVATVSWLFGE
jgi:hypothetical protein